MLRLLGETHIGFMARRRSFYFVSAAVILIGIISFIVHGGFRYGIDFEGGRLVEFRLSEKVPIETVRAAVSEAGFPSAEIQAISGTSDVLIRIPEIIEQKASEASPSALIRDELLLSISGLDAELLREESVGAKIGKEIRGQAYWAIILALGLILIYIGLRFELKFGLGAVAALVHDVLVTLTFFSLLDKEITMPVVAALLTIAGYSINDSIVVFDRIREQLVRLRRESFHRVLDVSINQMLSRTVITSVTTLFGALALLIFGGEVIHDFAFAITIGIIVGTYSSVFVASALILEMRSAHEARGGAR
ncbi:MAG: protein translocase subunit SecF [Candidatus Eisenbacteria sp.]|nr:protein translocase subunit SecF [Candidatus Eisenbacteria bacterium]